MQPGTARLLITGYFAILSRMTVVRRLRPGLLVLGAWVVFFALQGLLSVALTQRALSSAGAMMKINFSIAVLWASLSVGIAAWHRHIRARAGNVWSMFALHMPVLAASAIIDAVVSRGATMVIEGRAPRVSFAAYLVYYADFIIVAYIAVVAVAEALLVRRALLERQLLAKRLEASLSRARLDYLEAQLQPHFLFNSLGAVSELAYDAPAVAARVLRQLIAIFRTALARKSDEVPLGEEIVGIEPYLDIQRIRFADWLTIEYHVDDAAVDCLLPRFILQPLVENAIRHGLSGRSAPGRIDIEAMVDDGALIVRVVDNGMGLAGARAAQGRGIGLANVRDRLAILYGDDDRLRLTSGADGGAIAELRIPARRREEVPIDPVAERAPVSTGNTNLQVLRVPRVFRRPAMAIATAWLVCGLVWSQQSYAYNVLRERAAGLSWLGLIRNDLTSALVWALITPLVLFGTKRYPIRREGIAWRGLLYFGASVVTAIAHVALLRGLTERSGALTGPQWQLSYIVNFAIFCILASIGHRGMLLEWLRARELASAALTTELAAAQARAAKLQAMPRVLVNSLDGIAETVLRDPALTERQLTRLADYLRLSLECTDEQGMTPDRERALEAAVAALRESGAYSYDLTLSV